MALNVFQPSPTFGVSGGLALFTDSRLTLRATVYDLNGRPLPGNVVNVTGALIPEFQSASGILFFRAGSGEVAALSASGQRSGVVVSGAKGGNAALTSLIAALAQLGIVVDQTT